MQTNPARNRIWSLVFVLLYFGATVLLYPAWFALRNVVDTENRENRQLAAFPVAGQLPLAEYPAAFEEYLEDNAPFRNQWMTTNAAVNWRLFGTVESETVLLGKEGWLFMQDNAESAPIADYQGTNHYTEEQMAQIAADLAKLEENLRRRGCSLAVVVAPNKELVYRRYMPDGVPMVNSQSRADVLMEYLAGAPGLEGMALVWPEAELRALSAHQQVYFKYDTHWNNAGAAVASAALLRALGQPAPDVAELEFVAGEGYLLCDLANLSATWKLLDDDVAYGVQGWMPGVQQYVTADSEYYYSTQYASNAGNGQHLLMLRDSFGAAMQPFLATGFATSSYVHINAFGEDTIQNEAPDVFVLEICQRNLDRLLDYLPRLVEWTAM